MVNKVMTRLDSKEWCKVDEERVGCYFLDLGFKRVGEVLGLRMFDLFNMDRIDNIRAWEMIRNLYIYLNKNSEADRALEWSMMDQYFPFKEWRKAHKAKDARVVDLVMAFDINEKALQRLFGELTRAFYKSGEYNSRYYKYNNLDELKDMDSVYQEVTVHE